MDKSRGIIQALSLSVKFAFFIVRKTVNRLNIEFEKPFRVLNKSHLQKKLEGVQYHKFFPSKNLSAYYLPPPKVTTIGSELYHTGMMSEMLIEAIKRIPTRDIRNKALGVIPQKQIKMLTNEILELNNLTVLESLEHAEIVGALQQGKIPLSRIVMQMEGDTCLVYLDVGTNDLQKHGFKAEIGWGAIDESLIASMLYETGLLQKWRNNVLDIFNRGRNKII